MLHLASLDIDAQLVEFLLRLFELIVKSFVVRLLRHFKYCLLLLRKIVELTLSSLSLIRLGNESLLREFLLGPASGNGLAQLDLSLVLARLTSLAAA